MIYKVYYQENAAEVPVREKTKTIYVKAASVRDVRNKLKSQPYNIEFVTLVEEAYLEYEELHEDFKVLEL
ncbi:RNA polymerase epsilon subunit [Bacillus massiliigorillae]|uniref:RNA polymerase epsilon subunit n=1 Tax=Bacillus massiliigorillae TaxID=1243664 RepID=UPI0003A1F2A8|nr:RNA polymerase epsilon subunit [Bacillus massiliigorillae]